ncbi:MAG TPA: CDP-alcohol phosphatidyltransferase family protein [Planctomycetota bacterium]|nr:CDP-alcohol phosphatidyltransferase family protein [Planctomycetota bacterium]
MIPLHNLISISRYALTPLVAMLAWDEATQPLAVFLAILVGVSDFVDGPLARRAGDAKPLGALLDMTGDKVFLCTMLIVLSAMEPARSPAWAAWLITSRELIVLFLRAVAATRGKPLPIAVFGKLKTFMLYLLVPIALADASYDAVWFLAFASTASALASLAEYIVKMRGDLAAEFLRLPKR